MTIRKGIITNKNITFIRKYFLVYITKTSILNNIFSGLCNSPVKLNNLNVNYKIKYGINFPRHSPIYTITKRFYPGNLPVTNFMITSSTAGRVLKLFSKPNLSENALKTLPLEKESIKAIQQWYSYQTKRSLFFESIRNISKNHTLTFDSKNLSNLDTNAFCMINTIRKYIRAQNKFALKSTKKSNAKNIKQNAKESYEQKVMYFGEQRKTILTLMNKFKEQYNLTHKVDSNILNLFYNYLLTRQNILPFNEEQHGFSRIKEKCYSSLNALNNDKN